MAKSGVQMKCRRPLRESGAFSLRGFPTGDGWGFQEFEQVLPHLTTLACHALDVREHGHGHTSASQGWTMPSQNS